MAERPGDQLPPRGDGGRYSTDASIYQIAPLGVVVPRTTDDLKRVLALAAEFRVPVVPRGGGTSQGGPAIGEGLVVDTSKYLTAIREFDPANGTVRVEPGVVLDRLNAFLRPHRLWFPVDPATASQATLGGMAGNNSAGARSLRYGLMADHVRSVRAALAGGAEYCFGQLPERLAPFQRAPDGARRARPETEHVGTPLADAAPSGLAPD